MNKEWKQVLRGLRQDGYEVIPTNGGHFRLSHPAMGGRVFIPGSPSDRRAIQNLMAMLRRQHARPHTFVRRMHK